MFNFKMKMTINTDNMLIKFAAILGLKNYNLIFLLVNFASVLISSQSSKCNEVDDMI